MNKDFDKYDKVPSNFCLVPFLHKAIDGNGDINPCCIAEPHKMSDGKNANINFIDFDSFIKSKENNDFKEAFKRNERPDICHRCWKVDDHQGESHRKRVMTFFMNKSWEGGETDLHKTLESFFADNTQWQDVVIELDKIKEPFDLEIEPGTTCNFKCHFCGPHASSSWISDQKELYGTSQEDAARATKLGHWALDSELWNSEVMYNGKKFHFMGGEPMLINAHFKFLAKLAERPDAAQVRMSYNTNASTLPPDNVLKTVYDKFYYTRVAFSIDGIGDKFHYQRFPGDWAEAEANMETWVTNVKNIEAKIDPGWSVLNMLDMAELFLWADKFKRKFDLSDKQFDFDGHYYFGPHYCPQSLKPEQKEYFKNKMTSDLELLRNSNLTPRIMERAETIVDNMINHMMAKDSWNQETEDKRKYRIMGLDRIRKQTLKDFLPELNSVLKYYD